MKVKCLIVEDDPFSQRILDAQMRNYGETFCVSSAEGALTSFREAFEANTPFSLVCVDLGLPGMDGLELIQEFRTIGQKFDPENQVKIIITTAETGAETIEAGFETGCDAYLMKPCTTEEIERELMKMGLIDSA